MSCGDKFPHDQMKQDTETPKEKNSALYRKSQDFGPTGHLEDTVDLSGHNDHQATRLVQDISMDVISSSPQGPSQSQQSRL